MSEIISTEFISILASCIYLKLKTIWKSLVCIYTYAVDNYMFVSDSIHGGNAYCSSKIHF